MDDELDPAFLDLDLPSHAGSGLGDSLGAHFDPSLDRDLDDNSPALSLGAGFGSALGNELGELDEGADASPPRSRHSSNASTSTPHGRTPSSSLADQLDPADDGYATPRRRTGSGASQLGAGQTPQAGGNRMSLAFELASASGPPGGRTRDLMRELGIEEDEEEDEEEEGQSEDEREEQLERRLFAGGAAGDARDDPFGAGASPGRRPASRLRGRPSTASFASFAPAEQVEAPEEHGISQEELDAAFQEAAEALSSSMDTTGTFLSHLRQHVTASVDPSSSAPAPPAPDSLSSTLLSGSLQRSTSTPSPLAMPSAPPDYTDRQPVVEALASAVLKQLYDLAAQRERQTRELTELERHFARTDAGWKAALAMVEPLPLDGAAEVDEEDAALDAGEPSSPPLDDASVPSQRGSSAPDPSALAPSELSALRTLTTSLLSALSTITDLTQVQSALSSDAGRKLRALRAQVTTVKDELETAERSEAFVRDYEARAADERGGEGRYAQRAREEVRGASEALEEGWRRARSVFERPALEATPHEVGVAM